MAGTVHSKDKMFLRKFIGECDAEEHGKLEMNINMDGTPCIESKVTGQTWTLDWQELVHMAIEAGVAVPRTQIETNITEAER